jgi:hypothetical protein
VVVPLSALRLLFLLLVVPCVLQAHRLDEYLQAAQVVIEPAQVRLLLVLEPGVEVAAQVLQKIDLDHDQTISRAEAAAYIGTVQRELMLHLDGQRLQLKLDDSEFDTPAELSDGSGIIRLVFSAAVKNTQPGAHQLVFENRHMGVISVYLFNAMQPDLPAVQISRQRRNDTQSMGEIDYILASAPKVL